MKYTWSGIHTEWDTHGMGHTQSGTHGVRYKSGTLTELNTNGVGYTRNGISTEWDIHGVEYTRSEIHGVEYTWSGIYME